MMLNTLTDDELRRLVDTEPDNLAAMKEAASRFCAIAEQVADLEARISELEDELESSQNEVSELEAKLSEFQDA